MVCKKSHFLGALSGIEVEKASETQFAHIMHRRVVISPDGFIHQC